MTIREQIEMAKVAEYLTADQLALLVQFDRETIYRKAKRGQIPGAVYIGRDLRFIRVRVVAWIASLERTRRAPAQRRPDPDPTIAHPS